MLELFVVRRTRADRNKEDSESIIIAEGSGDVESKFLKF